MNLDIDLKTPFLSNPEDDFIPYACHYDEETLLTKSGELVLCIKLTSLENENVISQTAIVRETIRDAIKSSVEDNSIAIWLHTVRSSRDIRLKAGLKNTFSKSLHEAWDIENEWKNEYVNDIYLSIAVKGFDHKLSDFNDVFKSFFFSYIKYSKTKFLKTQRAKIEKIKKNILSTLKLYGAKVLSVYKENDIYYSEPMSFIGRIVNLKNDKYSLGLSELSKSLLKNKTAFGGNTAEMTDLNNSKKLFSIFSIKEYSEISSKILDKILQLPQELIITQTVLFTSGKEAYGVYENQDYISSVSQDENLAYITGLDKITSSDKGDPTDFIKSQITFTVSGNNKKSFQDNVERLYKTFMDLGILSVREDLALEQCYWAQLPGNFSYINREKYYSISSVAGFSSLQSFPIGRPTGYVWPEAVTIFRTAVNTPYFFNFHDKDKNGNTLILGPKRSGKSKLLNFLVSESLKFAPRIFYIDGDKGSEVFIRALGGKYYKIKKDYEAKNRLRLNPFLLNSTKENVQFLVNWINTLASYDKTDMVLMGTKESDLSKEFKKLNSVVESYLNSPPSKKSLSDFLNKLKNEGCVNITQKLKPWCDKNRYASIFDNERETTFEEGVTAFDISSIAKNPLLLKPVLMYLTHRVKVISDKEYGIFAIDSAWKLFNYPDLGDWLTNWLKEIKNTKTLAVLTSNGEKNLKENYIKDVSGCFGTKIYLGREYVTDEMKEVFDITKQEEKVLSVMSRSDYAFILKNSNDTIVASSKLDKLKESLDIITGSPESNKIMKEAIKESSRTPDEWIPIFFKKMKEYREEQKRLETERRKAAQKRWKEEQNSDLMY